MRSRTRRQTYSGAKGIWVSDFGTIVRILKQDGGFVGKHSRILKRKYILGQKKLRYFSNSMNSGTVITHSKWRRFPSIFAKFVLEE
jgi:hypothetical protein